MADEELAAIGRCFEAEAVGVGCVRLFWVERNEHLRSCHVVDGGGGEGVGGVGWVEELSDPFRVVEDVGDHASGAVGRRDVFPWYFNVGLVELSQR